MPPGPYYVLNTFTLQRLYYSFTTTFLTNFPVQQDCIFKPKNFCFRVHAKSQSMLIWQKVCPQLKLL